MSKEILTNEKFQQVMGANYVKVVSYNFDTGLWNTDTYAGYNIERDDVSLRGWLNSSKGILDRVLASNNQEVVAYVMMLTSAPDYKGVAKVSVNPRYDATGNAIVASVLCRDTHSGKISAALPKWCGVGSSVYPEHVVRSMSADFARGICKNGVLRKAVCNMCAAKSK